MKTKILSALKFLVFLALGIFFFWLAFRGQDFDAIKQTLLRANYWWMIPSLGFAFLSNLSRAIRWNLLIHPIGFRPKTLNTFGAVFMGYFVNLAVPRLGEITRCTVLSRYEKIPLQTLLGTVVAERVIDMISLLLILFFVIMVQFSLLSEFVSKYFLHPVEEKFSSLLNHGTVSYLIFFAAIIILVFISWRIIRHFKTTKLFIRLTELAKGFVQGFQTVGKLRSKWLFFGHTVFIWFCYTMMSYFCFFCFDFSSHLNILQGLTAMVFGGIGFVVPVQGGIGAYHYIVKQTMMVYGLSERDGLSFATLCHGGQFMAIVVLGLLGFIILPIYNRKEKKDEQQA